MFHVATDHECGTASHNCYYIVGRVVKPQSGGWIMMSHARAQLMADVLNELIVNQGDIPTELQERIREVFANPIHANSVNKEET